MVHILVGYDITHNAAIVGTFTNRDLAEKAQVYCELNPDMADLKYYCIESSPMLMSIAEVVAIYGKSKEEKRIQSEESHREDS